MKPFLRFLLSSGLLYVTAFTIIHYIPGLRRTSLDGDWYYSDIPLMESAEFYAFWPLRQISYGIAGVKSRHISEVLPVGLEGRE